jgi:hypothetical protein
MRTFSYRDVLATLLTYIKFVALVNKAAFDAVACY